MSGWITLGLQIDQLITGYARLIIAGVSDWSREHDANLIVFSGRVLRSPHGHEYQYATIFDHIKPGTIDALVIATGTQISHQSLDQYREYMRRFTGIPAVSMGIGIDGVPSILVDNRTGILEAMGHLTGEHGFRRIAFLKGPVHNMEAEARFAAYREAVSEGGLDDDAELCIPGDFTQAGARSALTTYLEQHGRADFQALLAANDEMAIGAVQLLSERGYIIPRDIAIIGFDNILISQFSVPPITTIEQPIYEQGRRAADFAARLVQGESVPQTVVLPTRLIVRTSCGCLPRAVVELDSLPFSPGRPGDSPDKKAIIDRCLKRLTQEELALADRSLPDLLDSLIRLVGKEGFLESLREALYADIARKIDISPWQTLLTVLQGELIGKARSIDEVSSLWASFQKARVLLSEALRLEQGKGWRELQGHLGLLRLVMERLISVASIDELMTDLADELARLDIRTCFIAGYPSEIRHLRGEEWLIPEWAEVLLAWVNGKRMVPTDGERSFSPAENLVPPGFLPKNRRYMLVAMSMYFREDQIGYIVFEPGKYDSAIYETFCVQLSNILKGSLLFTARQKAEEALRLTLSRWQTTFDAVSDSILLLDTDQRLVQVNSATLHMFQTQAEEIRGRRCWEIVHGTNEPIPECPFLRMVQSRHRETLEFPLGERWIAEVVDPIFDDKGDLSGAVHIVHDITEHKRSEEELRKLSTAIEQSPTLVVITDLAGNIEYVNPKFTEITGYTLEEVRGRNPRILKSGETPPEIYRELWQAITAGREWRGEFHNKKKDGTSYWERAAVSPIRDATGAITHFLAVKEDITAQKALENQFLQAQKMESIGRLAGGVAHDFNNMLTVIIGHANAALARVDPGERLHYNLQEILEAGQRSADLTSQLLAFARKQTVRPVVLDLNETVSGMLGMLHRLIGEEIELSWKPGLDLWSVKIDPAQIGQVLVNLSVNARDAIAGVGTLTIGTDNTVFDEISCEGHVGLVPGEYVRLTMSDTGAGMDRHILEHIFEPFFTTREIGKGTGLGLATVYGILKQNNGFIYVYSEPGEGTTFKIYFPRVRSLTAAKPEDAEKKPVHGTETVLLVEDEEAVLALGETILAEHGYTVLAARTPTEALALAERNEGPIHLLITDVVMPEMNGKELKEQLLVLRPALKVLFMSGYTANMIAHHGVLEEGVQFLQKPFSAKTLAEKVREVLDH